MKEHPILSQAEMVRAILAGRETHTRRKFKQQPHEGWFPETVGWYEPTMVDKRTGEAYPGKAIFGAADGDAGFECPYGVPGDHLWVRETFAETGVRRTPYTYRADWKAGEDAFERFFAWKPSIFMPRKASRITLEITTIRVERLQDISEADAVAEGVTINVDAGIASEFLNKSISPAQLEYFALWEKINGKGSWAKNPWVWVLTFKKL